METLQHANPLHFLSILAIVIILAFRLIGLSNGILLQAGLWIIKKLFWLLLIAVLLYFIAFHKGHGKSNHEKPTAKSHTARRSTQNEILWKT